MGWIAMLSMLIDHIGYSWFPEENLWRMIGRLAFPIYAFGIVKSMEHTSDRRQYLKRLALLALISQIPYMFLFDTLKINVIGTFAVIVFTCFQTDENKSYASRAVWFIGAALLLEMFADYGAYAMLLVLVYRYTTGLTMLLLHFTLNVLWWYGKGWEIQMWSVLPSLLFAAWQVRNVSKKRLRIPAWLWRGFYPVHLMVLVLLRFLL
ncbi:TraX family protein [Paenibacillus eucommiae]|uniref:Conjugal transfer protein TraX n=1 Tax=Paenibacillus eucommiae TaxID=1355755 RepID=A0ABS4J0U1_9BACL|nr:TraX family protein [Paenibacillus eucommiae]MBP1993440.1 hypothetical protein [Paenibacillus eucommiae]